MMYLVGCEGPRGSRRDLRALNGIWGRWWMIYVRTSVNESQHDCAPIVFDFDQPETKNITDTVKLLAQMVRDIIVDLSDPNSAPYGVGGHLDAGPR
jgi:hypothetical protein